MANKKNNITFNDIAKYTNFSKTTISRYFNHPETLTEQNRNIIAEALEKLNYKENKVAMSFQSSKGTYDENAGVITLYDNTYIVLEDWTSLNTDKLTWYGNGKETVADGHVVIKKNRDMIATAQKGVIDPGYEKFRIIGKTNTKIFSDKEK